MMFLQLTFPHLHFGNVCGGCKVVQGGARGWWWCQLHVVCIAMTIVVDDDGGINVGVPQQQLSRIRPEFGLRLGLGLVRGEKE